jgi:peptidoglycan/LPS O-acetylase OafA/YrhL
MITTITDYRLINVLQWSTVTFSGGLALGAYCAIVYSEDGGLEARLPLAQKGILIFGALFLALSMVPRRFYFDFINIITHQVSWFFFASLIVIVLTNKEKKGLLIPFFTCGIMRTFGKISYGLYVYHGILRPVFERIFPRDQLINIVGSPILGIVLYFALTIGFTFMLSWLSWHLYEKQFLKVKRYFESKKGTETNEGMDSISSAVT